jgi:site-specific DNA recombinase
MKKQDFKVLKTKDLYPFPDNPFHVAEDETLSELAESIKEFGIVTPIITRPKEDGDGYEVIAGQRRVRASELAGINTVPAFVLPLDRDRAIITLVDSNLQRENILPSERAFAYKMKSEAMKRQGFRTDLTSSQVVTLNKSAMDITPFRNILNEMYAADISVKIKSAYRARFQQGKFMGTTAPYGYIKDPADHNHLLIDDKVAHVVKEIFDLALKGNGVAKICRHLNKQHILRPAAYAAERGETGFERHFEGNEDKRYIWSGNSVRSILRSPIYAGNLVGYKRIAANMKSKKRPSKLPEEWEVIPNTHEGIVTQEEFDIVQQLITSRRLPQNKGGFVNIFAGVIKCVDCGCALRAMNVHRRKRPEIIDCVQYSCNNYARNGRSECSAHNIEARDLFNAVLADINCFADMAVNDEKAVRAIEKRLTETDQSRAKALEKERKKLNKRLAELDRLFSSLYEDKVMERITERNFEMMSGKYQKEQLEIEARLKEVTETLNESYEKSRGIRDFLALIRNYQGLKELDATVINALIDKILVSEREKMADGTVKQEFFISQDIVQFQSIIS